MATDQQNAGLELAIELDRDTAARLGVTPALFDNVLYDAYGQRQVATTFTDLNEYRVVMEVAPSFAAAPSDVKRLYVGTPTGSQVPIHALASSEVRSAALAVNHQGQFPSITLSFNLAPGVALGQAVDAIHAREAEMGLPPSIRASFQGTAQAFKDSLASQPILILAALLTVYIVLGVLYESYAHPLTILSTLPSAGLGALLALLVTGSDLNVIALIGIVLLIGIVKKNAILMIDFALEAEREEGKDAVRGRARSVPPALPSDPDDDAGRAFRRRSARARHGCRRRAPPSTRPHHHRRPHGFAAPHAVHDADRLPDARPSRAPHTRAAFRAPAGRRRTADGVVAHSLTGSPSL